MTNPLPDSFDLTETVELLNELIKTTGGSVNDTSSVFKTDSIGDSVLKKDDLHAYPDRKDETLSTAVFRGIPGEVISSEIKVPESGGDDPLENILFLMCKRGGFKGAVLADSDGLPMAVFNSPVDEDLIAAYASILGQSLEKAESFLSHREANNISLDINNLDKIVLRRFKLRNLTYFLMIIAAQDIDERAEVELTISEIINLLK